MCQVMGKESTGLYEEKVIDSKILRKGAAYANFTCGG